MLGAIEVVFVSVIRTGIQVKGPNGANLAQLARRETAKLVFLVEPPSAKVVMPHNWKFTV